MRQLLIVCVKKIDSNKNRFFCKKKNTEWGMEIFCYQFNHRHSKISKQMLFLVCVRAVKTG